MNMHYCSQNTSLSYPWIPNGINHCFIETITVSVCLAFIFLLGIPQIIFLKRGNLVTSRKSKLIFFHIQIFCMILLPTLSIIRFILQNYSLYNKTLYGYMILTLIGTVLSQILAIYLVFQERKYESENSRYGKHCMVLIGFWLLTFLSENLPFVSMRSDNWWFLLSNQSDKIEFSFWAIRFGSTILILLLGLNGVGLRERHPNRYNRLSISDSDDGLSTTRSTWSNLIYKSKLVLDATWPDKSLILQFKIIVCIITLIIGRVLNVFIPLTYKYVVDSLTPALFKNSSQYENYPKRPVLELFFMGERGNPPNGLTLRWDLIVVFGLLRILQGSGAGSTGVLNSVRTQLWVTVQQYSSRRIAVKLFAHIHGLSLRWHLSKKTGEVLRIMDRGTDSLQNLLNYVLFNIAPTLIDILIGIIYFASAFNGYFALIVTATMVLYLGSTVVITEWRTKYRRNMNKLDNEKNAKAVDSLLNFETVKYFGAEKHEVANYESAIIGFQRADWISQTTLNILNLVQGFAINVGFISGAILCAYYVVKGEQFTVGDFVLYCTYIVQLNAPLNFFGTYYR